MSKQQTQRRRKRYNPGSAYAGRVRPRGVFALFGNLKLFYFAGAAIMLASLGVGGLYGSNLLGGGGAHGAGGGSNDQDFVVPDDDAPPPSDDPEAISPPEPPRLYAAGPPLTIDPNARYVARLSTAKGDIRIELLPGTAPNTVNNFVFLAREGFYDGLPFHYVAPGFSVQAGDPSGRGDGGPGYDLPQEAPAPFERGLVGMANASQFFISLTGGEPFEGYTPFGRITDGLEVVESLEQGDVIQSVRIDEAGT